MAKAHDKETEIHFCCINGNNCIYPCSSLSMIMWSYGLLLLLEKNNNKDIIFEKINHHPIVDHKDCLTERGSGLHSIGLL